MAFLSSVSRPDKVCRKKGSSSFCASFLDTKIFPLKVPKPQPIMEDFSWVSGQHWGMAILTSSLAERIVLCLDQSIPFLELGVKSVTTESDVGETEQNSVLLERKKEA